jgi:hypothetical protein
LQGCFWDRWRFGPRTEAFHRNRLASRSNQAYPTFANLPVEEEFMARKLIIGLVVIAAASPLSATVQDVVPPGAPAGTPETKYCMHIEAITGSRI